MRPDSFCASLVGVDRGDDRARGRQARKDPAEQFELRAAGRAGGTQVLARLTSLLVELVVAERVQRRIARGNLHLRVLWMLPHVVSRSDERCSACPPDPRTPCRL
jgi:hypothetical protein